jgi:hypothetical protein
VDWLLNGRVPRGRAREDPEWEAALRKLRAIWRDPTRRRLAIVMLTALWALECLLPMSTPPAGALPPFFVPDGEAFVATESTRGPWSRQHQHGGPPAALLGRAMEQLVGDGALLIRVLGAETEPQAVRRLVAALASPSSCRQGGRSRPADPPLWSASPVTWRKLARLGIRPIRQALRQG